DSDHDVLVIDDGSQLGVVANLERADPGPHALAVNVEDGHDPEAVIGEDVRGRDRGAEMAGTKQGDVVLPRRAQDLADLADERLDAIAHAALAELPESTEIATDLGR